VSALLSECRRPVLSPAGGRHRGSCHAPAYIGMDEPEYPAEPLTPEFRARLIAAVDRQLRVQREILLLAGHAGGHLPGGGRMCRACRKRWPCPEVFSAARSALDAFADC
jgi:hypothetical protein